MSALSRLTRTLMLCIAGLSCAPDSDSEHHAPPSPLAPRAAVAQGLEQEAAHDFYWQVPGCTASGAPSCGTTSALIGRGSVGPEANAPNTLQGSTCADGDDGLFHTDGSVEALRISTLDGRTWLADNRTVRLEVDVWGAPASASTLMLFSAADVQNPRWVHLATLPTQGGPETLSHTFTLPVGRLQAVRAALVDSSQAQGEPCTPGGGNDHDDLIFKVAEQDVLPPHIAPNGPGDGDRVAGIVTLKALAHDDQAMDRVDYLINGSLVGSDTTAPFELSWDSASVPEGVAAYVLRAWDAAGNTQTWSGTLNPRHDSAPPSVTLLEPSPGARIKGTVTLSAEANDDVGVRRVEFYLDDTVLIGSTDSSPEDHRYSYSWDTRETPPGPHRLVARAHDAVGKTTATQELELVVDQPPTVSLTAPVPDSTVSGDVVLSVDASDDLGVSTVRFSVNGQWIAEDSTPPYSVLWPSTQLPNGSYTVRVSASDGTNETSTPPVTVTVDNDRTPPTVAITSPADGATVQGRVTVAATASDARSGIARVQFRVASTGQLIGTDTSAPYSYSMNTRAFPNGPLSLEARALDGAGNESVSGISLTVDNDLTPPSVAFTSPTNGATVDGIVPLVVSASDARSTVARVDFFLGSDQIGVDTSAPYSFDLNTTYLPNGPHTLTARATDSVGNMGTASLAISVERDVTPPTLTITSPTQGATVQGFVQLSADASDARSGVTQVAFYRDATLLTTLTRAPYSVIMGTSSFANGPYTFTAKARDGRGNESTASVTVTLDNDRTPPTVALTSPSEGARLEGLVTLTADASDGRGVSRVDFLVGSLKVGTGTSAPYAFTLNTRAFPNGSHTLTAKAVDTSGNVSAASVTVTMDNDQTLPTVVITSPAQGTTVRGNLTMTADASDERSGVASVRFSAGSRFLGTDTSAPYSSDTVSTRAYPNGPLTLTATAYDGKGNERTASVTVTVDNDQTPPSVAFTSPAEGATVQGTLTLTADASDERSGIKEVWFYSNVFQGVSDTTAPFTYALDTRALANGPVSLKALAIDGEGNSRETSVTVTVDNDQTPPSVTLTSPAEGATVQGTLTLTADASDERSGVVRVEFLRGSTLIGTDTTAPYSYVLDTKTLGNGQISLGASAVDGAGNRRLSSVRVTVDNDNTPPSLSIDSPLANSTVRGLTSVSFSASDERSGVAQVEIHANSTLLCTSTSPAASCPLNTYNLPNGWLTLTARARDGFDNVSTSSVRVYVNNDSTPPTSSITYPTPNAVLELGNTYTFTASASDNTEMSHVNFYLDGTFLGSRTTAPYSVNWTPASYHVGKRTLTAVAWDTTNNSNTASVDFTVTSTASAPSTGSFTYSASTTNSAASNTVNKSLTLSAGKRLTLGTCGVTGASFSGDTYLRLYDPSGVQVASNDDACGGAGSNFVYTVPASGNYQVRAGCYSNGSCNGTVAWTLQ